MRIALGVEYDGSPYCGWQTQPTGCGVQDALEAALARIASGRIQTQCAGRTDAGVHALGQVVHFDTGTRRPLTAWVRGVNTLLPRTLAVIWAREVDGQFHARYQARSRTYVYLLLNRAERPGLQHGYLGWHHRPLNLEAMRDAAACLLGVHDFSAFRAAECQARSPVKELRRLEIARQGDILILRFVADAFLHHMVRNIVGCLVKIGNGSRPPGWLQQVLDGRDREQAAPTFPASGLYLTGVEYDAGWGLPQALGAGNAAPAALSALLIPATGHH